MLPSRHLALAVPLASALLLLSCQGNTPLNPQSAPAAVQEVAPALIPASAPGDGASWQMMSGVYSLDISTQNGPEATLTPLRMATAKGDAFAIDATNFLRVSPCTDCLQVTALRNGANAGEVEVDFAMKHPFPLPVAPYTTASRLDLHAFDVMGYLLNNPTTPLTLGDGDTASPIFLRNADGYSDLLDLATEPAFPTPNASEHPYRVFFRDDTAGNFDGAATNGFAAADAPTGHNVMSMGADFSTVTYTVQIPPSGQLQVGFAIGLSWGQPAQGRGTQLGQRLNPVYYLPEFHHKAPWTLTASISNNNLEEGNPTSNATLDIALRDWQLGATVDPAWEFGVTSRDAVKGSSDLASLTIYAPGLLAAPQSINPTSGTGTGVLDDLVFSTLLSNTNNALEGTYPVYIKAVDSRAPGSAVLDRDIQPVTLGDFHTGTIVMVDVAPVNDPNTPPIAAFVGTEVFLGCKDCTKTIDASASTDLEDPTDLDFEFDWDVLAGDPLNFAPDTPIQATPTISHQFDTEALPTHIGVRVTDPDGASDVEVLPVNFDPVTLGNTVSIAPQSGSAIQLFNNNTSSAAANLVANQNYVFVAVERHSGSGATAGANSEIRFWRTADGVSWTPLATLPTTNSYGPIWDDYALAAGTDGNLYVTYAVQDGPTYGSDWATRIHVNPSEGTGAWSMVLNDSSVAGQPLYRTFFIDPTNPNLIINHTRMNGGIRQWRSTTGGAGPFTVTSPYGGNPNNMTILRKPNGHLVTPYLDASGDALRAQTSIDSGATWSLTGSLLLDPATNWFCGAGALDPTDATGNTMTFAFKLWISAGVSGTPGIHLARTTNGGATWVDINNSVETVSPYSPGDPAIIRTMYDAQGGLYVTYFKALWGADLRGFVAYSGDNGTNFLTDEVVYDTNPNPSWPGMQLVQMPNGCDMMSAYSRMQNIESRVF